MTHQQDGTVLFTEEEFQSLTKLIEACSDAISSLANDGDFLGWDNYRALGMWEDKLKGESGPLDDYVGEDEKGDAVSVTQWLDDYGRKK